MRVRPYISDFMDFHFYENIKFYRAASYPTNVESFGKWLGPSNNMGSIICYVILKENGETTNCSTVRCLTVEESTLQTEKQKLQAFQSQIDKSLGEYQDDTSKILRDGELTNNNKADEEWLPVTYHTDGDVESTPTEPSGKELVEDYYLVSTKIPFPRGQDNSKCIGNITEQKRSHDRMPIGWNNDNPILDNRQYLVK